MSVTNCHIINNVHTDLATKNGMAAWCPYGHQRVYT
jgi:hypothetical protein